MTTFLQLAVFPKSLVQEWCDKMLGWYCFSTKKLNIHSVILVTNSYDGFLSLVAKGRYDCFEVRIEIELKLNNRSTVKKFSIAATLL